MSDPITTATIEPAALQTGPLFPLGHVAMTIGICESGLTGAQLHALIRRHLHGSWDMSPADIAANRAAMTSGARIFGAFTMPEVADGQVWIITEAADDTGQRRYSTVLLPSEY